MHSRDIRLTRGQIRNDRVGAGSQGARRWAFVTAPLGFDAQAPHDGLGVEALAADGCGHAYSGCGDGAFDDSDGMLTEALQDADVLSRSRRLALTILQAFTQFHEERRQDPAPIHVGMIERGRTTPQRR